MVTVRRGGGHRSITHTAAHHSSRRCSQSFHPLISLRWRNSCFIWHHSCCGVKCSCYMSQIFLSPWFSKSGGHQNSFVGLSVGHKNLKLADIFWSISDKPFLFVMHDPCDKPCLLAPCHDLVCDLQGQIWYCAADLNSPILLVHVYHSMRNNSELDFSWIENYMK